MQPDDLLTIAATLETGLPLTPEQITALCSFLRAEADRRTKFKRPRKFASDAERYAFHNARRALKRKS